MCLNLLHLPLFNFAYLFFLSFPVNLFLSFIFTASFPNWHLALVLLSSLCISQFCSSIYNFWFPLFARSISCTLFLLDIFGFAYGCIYICVYSVTLFIVVINLSIYVGLLQFYRIFLSSFFFHFKKSFIFFIILTFNFFETIIFFYIYSFVCLSYCSFSLAVKSLYKSSSSTSI